jgi:mitogen-activated protein kinase 1/3
MPRGSLGLNKYGDWEVGDDYVCEKTLGTGSYGQVVLATKKSTGQKVAINRMENIFEDEIDCKRILREICLLRKLKHPMVVELIDIIEPKDPANFDTLYAVMEYAESDLKKVIKSSIHLGQAHIQTIIYNLLLAVRYLHQSNVLHRDIKPANVLVNEDCTVKLCDFGLARSITGVETTEMILSKKAKEEEAKEIKASSKDEEATITGAGLSKIHHQDEVSQAEEEKKNDTPMTPQEKQKADMKSRLLKTKD